MTDTAEITGSVGECLYSIGNRIEVAKILIRLNEQKLLDTVLEDIVRATQDLCDEHCIVREV